MLQETRSIRYPNSKNVLGRGAFQNTIDPHPMGKKDAGTLNHPVSPEPLPGLGVGGIYSTVSLSECIAVLRALMLFSVLSCLKATCSPSAGHLNRCADKRATSRKPWRTAREQMTLSRPQDHCCRPLQEAAAYYL